VADGGDLAVHEGELTEHAARNREAWAGEAAAYVAGAERSWATEEMTWGMLGMPERELCLLGEVAGRDVVELGCGTAYGSAWLARRGAHVVGVDLTPEQLDTAHHLVESGRASFVLTVFVVYLSWAVDGYSHQETMLPEEIRPFFIQQHAVGLDGVVYLLPVRILLLQSHGLAVEIQAENQRFAAVPVEGNFRHIVGGNILPYHSLKHRLAHHGLAPAVDIRLVQVVAILAVQVAE
jgi:hypothetical protein